MNNLFVATLLCFILVFFSCRNEDVVIPVDSSIQAAADSMTIVNYINDLGYSGSDSVLSKGVHFVILDSGDQEVIDESDIVSFNFIGKLLDNTIFNTTIEKTADSIRVAVEADIMEGDTLDTESALLTKFREDRNYEPLKIVYSASGWTIENLRRTTNLFPLFGDGFVDGISAVLGLMKVGGSSLIVIPSSQAYGSLGSGVLIKPNTVIAYVIYPIEVTKQ